LTVVTKVDVLIFKFRSSFVNLVHRVSWHRAREILSRQLRVRIEICDRVTSENQLEA